MSIQDRLDAVHKAQQVGKKGRFSVQNLDAFTLRNRLRRYPLILEQRKQTC